MHRQRRFRRNQETCLHTLRRRLALEQRGAVALSTAATSIRVIMVVSQRHTFTSRCDWNGGSMTQKLQIISSVMKLANVEAKCLV